MATTYKKNLKTITVTPFAGDAITIADADKPIASNALYEFEDEKTMHLPTDDGIVLVPFHAVASVLVASEATDVTRADARCPESGETGETETGETETGETETGETETGETETGETETGETETGETETGQ